MNEQRVTKNNVVHWLKLYSLRNQFRAVFFFFFYMSKTIFNNLNKEVKSLVKNLCETYSNNTNGIIIKNQVKKTINGIFSELDENVCVCVCQ